MTLCNEFQNPILTNYQGNGSVKKNLKILPMVDYEVSSLKESFPELKIVQNDHYLLPVLTFIIEKFIPILLKEWPKKIGTDYEIREYGKEGSPEYGCVHIIFIVKGKMNSVYIWGRTADYSLPYTGTSQLYPYGDMRCYVKVRTCIRFYEENSECFFKNFLKFLKSLKMKELIPEVIKNLGNEMTKGGCTKPNDEEIFIQLSKLVQ